MWCRVFAYWISTGVLIVHIRRCSAVLSLHSCHPLSRHRANENNKTKLSPVRIFRRDKKLLWTQTTKSEKKTRLVVKRGLSSESCFSLVFYCCSICNKRSPFDFRPWSSRAWKQKRDIVKLRSAAQRFSYIERAEHFLSSVLRRTSTSQQRK